MKAFLILAAVLLSFQTQAASACLTPFEAKVAISNQASMLETELERAGYRNARHGAEEIVRSVWAIDLVSTPAGYTASGPDMEFFQCDWGSQLFFELSVTCDGTASFEPYCEN